MVPSHRFQHSRHLLKIQNINWLPVFPVFQFLPRILKAFSPFNSCRGCLHIFVRHISPSRANTVWLLCFSHITVYFLVLSHLASPQTRVTSEKAPHVPPPVLSIPGGGRSLAALQQWPVGVQGQECTPLLYTWGLYSCLHCTLYSQVMWAVYTCTCLCTGTTRQQTASHMLPSSCPGWQNCLTSWQLSYQTLHC